VVTLRLHDAIDASDDSQAQRHTAQSVETKNIGADEAEDGWGAYPPTDNSHCGSAAVVTLRLHDAIDASDDSQAQRHTGTSV